MYDQVTWLYSRNWHNIVNQVYFNKKNNKTKRIKVENSQNSKKVKFVKKIGRVKKIKISCFRYKKNFRSIVQE